MGNSSVEFPLMVCGEDGGPLRAEPMMIVSKTSPNGERLRLLKLSVMNLRLPK
jgi:hypothetical protein